MIRGLSIACIVVGLLAALGQMFGWDLPSLSWFFSMGIAFGWSACVVLIIAGLAGLLFLPPSIRWNPVTLRRFKRFRSLGRGWWSLVILGILVVMALLDQALVGRRALMVSYHGHWYFPAFVKTRYPAKTFGLPQDTETDYRELNKQTSSGKINGWVVMPIVPWDSVLDSDDQEAVDLELRDGKYYKRGDSETYSGRAISYYLDHPGAKHTDLRFRRGEVDGEWRGYAPNGALVESRFYNAGNKDREHLTGEMTKEAFESAKTTPFKALMYPPIPPLWEAKHYLGTDSRGWDVLAQIYGGWQVNLKAVVIFLLLTYVVGILIGTLMGYLGKWFDLICQRFIEILDQLPFLYIVMIVVSVVGVANMTLMLLLEIICFFSWTFLTYPLRALAYREKERDYVAAARLQGASTLRIIFRYILPNLLATIVTYIPFSVAAIITSLTALSFIGFGLPETYPSWGWLFDDGSDYLSAVWISSSTFNIMVFVLLLVTFVGEALREAFDPKKFSTYQ